MGRLSHILIFSIATHSLACAVDVTHRVAHSAKGASTEELAGTLEEVSLSLFSEHLIPEFNICKGCHGNGQASPVQFASSDLQSAHDIAIKRVNFDDVEASVFVARMDAGHNCGSECETKRENFIDAIILWGEGRAEFGGGGDSSNLTTIAIPIPYNPRPEPDPEDEMEGGEEMPEESTGLDESMIFEIGSLIGAMHAGGNILMRVDVKRMGGGTGYQLDDLRFLSRYNQLFVRGITPQISGKSNVSNQGLIDFCEIIPANEEYHPVSGSTTIAVEEYGDNDKISFTFEELHLATHTDSCD